MFGFSYADILKQIPQIKPREYIDICDPIFEHCIQLQKYRLKVEELIQLTVTLKEVDNDSERNAFLSSLPPIPKLPEFSHKKHQNKRNAINNGIELPEEAINSLLCKAVARVLFVQGYTDVPSSLLKELSKMVGCHLKSLISSMLELTPTDEPISVESLDAALQEERINGVKELHCFYNDRIVSFHDSLYFKCKQLQNTLQNNMKKLDDPVAQNLRKRKRSNEDVTHCVKREGNGSTLNKKEENNEDENYTLKSNQSAEVLFVNREFKKELLCASSEVKKCETNSIKFPADAFMCKNINNAEIDISTANQEELGISLKSKNQYEKEKINNTTEHLENCNVVGEYNQNLTECPATNLVEGLPCSLTMKSRSRSNLDSFSNEALNQSKRLLKLIKEERDNSKSNSHSNKKEKRKLIKKRNSNTGSNSCQHSNKKAKVDPLFVENSIIKDEDSLANQEQIISHCHTETKYVEKSEIESKLPCKLNKVSSSVVRADIHIVEMLLHKVRNSLSQENQKQQNVSTADSSIETSPKQLVIQCKESISPETTVCDLSYPKIISNEEKVLGTSDDFNGKKINCSKESVSDHAHNLIHRESSHDSNKGLSNDCVADYHNNKLPHHSSKKFKFKKQNNVSGVKLDANEFLFQLSENQAPPSGDVIEVPSLHEKSSSTQNEVFCENSGISEISIEDENKLEENHKYLECALSDLSFSGEVISEEKTLNNQNLSDRIVDIIPKLNNTVINSIDSDLTCMLDEESALDSNTNSYNNETSFPSVKCFES